MNKLYVIKWMLPNNFEISRSCFWNPTAAKAKMIENPEWEFVLVENNETHMVCEAR